MVTDQDYHKIANDVYKVDSSKLKIPRREGEEVAVGKYIILKSEDNTENGMQAMAVAPVDKYVVSGVNWYIVP
ncbi:hypothetical protein [Streptococcus pluranimalium]|uniref:Uncharacterized protein n=1 Tax=Streptococcus pluranimalium TaxID=82348 RepID=A0A2L0D2P0_9STRE|nr:hypothetical protein [Streptococcus pluranimalium]AUW96075.1 hypothetical protein C0J00_02515 [Streptococcus pluranimalium]